MSTPNISILMPVRNESRYLSTALHSLLKQTLEDWELVVVDDGSTDETPDILNRFAAKDRRIRILNQPPAGLVPALNRGLHACRGAFIARMDGDDVCHPQRLAKQLDSFRKDSSLTLVASSVRHFPRMEIKGGMLAYEAWQNSTLTHSEITTNLFVESPFAHPSVMFRRTAIIDAGGYRCMPWAEDYDLWLRLAERGARFARLPDTLLYWRDRPHRLTRTADNCTLDAFRACKAHFLKRSFLKDCSAVTLCGAGLEGKAWRKALLKEGIQVSRWIDVDNKKIGQTIHGAKVSGPDQLKKEPGKALITIGMKGARDMMRQWAQKNQLIEGKDFLCVT